MIEFISLDLESSVFTPESVETQASETGNPIEYATSNPLEASGILIFAVGAALVARWTNDRTAKDKNS
jgi:hypothetical protein